MAIGAMAVVAPIAGASAIVPVDLRDRHRRPALAAPVRRDRLRARRRRRSPRRSTRRAASARVAAGVGLALLAAVGFGFYFPPMHAAGEADPFWASLHLPHHLDRDRRSLAVAVRRPRDPARAAGSS